MARLVTKNPVEEAIKDAERERIRFIFGQPLEIAQEFATEYYTSFHKLTDEELISEIVTLSLEGASAEICNSFLELVRLRAQKMLEVTKRPGSIEYIRHIIASTMNAEKSINNPNKKTR